MDNYQGFIGKILDGRYRILELVGVGGMAVVLKAEDLVMNRVVAIKILNERYNGDEEAEKRFINESKAVAMLSNKNIVGVYDVAIYPDIKYIVMEFLDGITLRNYMDNKKVLPWKEACVYTLQILRALEHAHSKNVIHRDIKPQNIILLKEGEVKVTDFGIAKIPDSAESNSDEKAIGTVYYISPEQASGKPTTFASDIYSVGIMLYEQVTGELPFTADSPVTIAMMQINDTQKDVRDINPDIPLGVQQIIAKSMAKQPEERFADAHSMLKAIDYVLKNPDVVFIDGEQEAFPSEDETQKININLITTGDLGNYVINIGEQKKETEKTDKEERAKRRAERVKRRKQQKKERPSHSVFPVITGVFFAFMIVTVAIAGYLAVKWVPSLFETEEPKDFFVKNFIDMQYSTELKDRLESEGYVVTVEDVYRQGLGFGIIVDQDPQTGNKRVLNDKCRITLTVNRYPDNLTVPNVKYMTVSEAEKLLKQYNLKTTISYVSDTFANDKQVVSTNPEIGAAVNGGATVTLYVNRVATVSKTKTMPNVVGKLLSDVIDSIESSYYTVVLEYKNSEEPDGYIFEQSIPAHTGDYEAWTEVVLVVSKYTKTTGVEYYIGMSLDQARTKIEENGFVVGTVKYDPKASLMPGTVVSQSVAKGTLVPKGTIINLIVSGSGQDLAAPVPNVTGKKSGDAISELEKAGFTVKVVKEASAMIPDTVLKQSIGADVKGQPFGTEIVITVSVSQDAIVIEDYTGYTVEQILEKFDDMGITLGEITFTSEGEAPEYTVVAQTVAAGEAVMGNNAIVGITLFGEARLAKEMPTVAGIGMAVGDAVDVLRSAWYNVIIVNEQSKEHSGLVIRQSIEAGSADNAIGTKVIITVSIKQTTTIVPDFTGLTLTEAMARLAEYDLVLGDVNEVESKEKDGTVVGQSIEEGEEVPLGTSVSLDLCRHIGG